MSKTVGRLLIVAISCLLILSVAFFVTARAFARRFEPDVRSRVIRYLEQRFHSQVTLTNLRIHLPNLSPIKLFMMRGRGAIARVEGSGLSVRFNGRRDVPPLLSIDSFAFDLDLGTLRQSHPTVPHVTLDGMTIVLPPKSDGSRLQDTKSKNSTSVIIDRIDISRARLIVLPNDAAAKPLDFGLDSVRLTSAGISQRLGYQATFTNPRPPGLIQFHGIFGPWNSESPADTPLEGDYDFSNADLGVFKGIAGFFIPVGILWERYPR
jgi:hypothetical protein